MDKQRYTIHYTENYRSSDTNPTKSYVIFRKGIIQFYNFTNNKSYQQKLPFASASERRILMATTKNCENMISVRENREWTIQRNWQHQAHKTKDENKQSKTHNTTCVGHHYTQAQIRPRSKSLFKYNAFYHIDLHAYGRFLRMAQWSNFMALFSSWLYVGVSWLYFLPGYM